MSYETLAGLTQEAFGGVADPKPYMGKLKPKFEASSSALPFEYFVKTSFQEDPEAQQLRMSLPRNDSATVYNRVTGEFIGLKSKIGGADKAFNKYSGKEIKYADVVDRHEKIEHLNFDLHVGYWGGMFGKIFTFVVGVITTSLPVTGFLIWWGRRKKKR